MSSPAKPSAIDTKSAVLSKSFVSLLNALTEALPWFSLDLVKLVQKYLIYATAKAGDQPTQLFLIGPNYTLAFLMCCDGVACADSGNIWISCYNIVRVFDADGRFLHNANPGKGKWRRVEGLAVAADEEGFVCDRDGHCIVVCRPDGSQKQRMVGKGLKGRYGKLHHPKDVAVDSEAGLMFVTSDERLLLLKDGVFVCAWKLHGPDPEINAGALDASITSRFEIVYRKNTRIGRFVGSRSCSHSGMAIDAEGNWFDCDYFENCVRVSSPSQRERLITTIGGKDHGLFKSPSSICIDRNGRIYVGCDKRVHVLAFESPE